MSGTTQANIAVATPTFAKRKARALIGWLTEEDGALYLAGRQAGGAADPAHRDRCRQARAVAATRNANVDQRGAISALPAEFNDHILQLRGRPWGQKIIADVGEPAWVDLRLIRAIQPTIHVQDATVRVTNIDVRDPAALAALTLPIPPDDPPDLQAVWDPTKLAFLAASPSPNLRVMAPLPPFQIEVSPGCRVNALGFAVGMLPSFLNVVGVSGRFFLSDGYHRAFGLLNAGITHVPALVRQVGTVQEARLNAGMLSPDVFLGDRPPLLSDYLDDAVAADTSTPISTKMVVIQALELQPLG